MGLHSMNHLESGFLTISAILPCLNLLQTQAIAASGDKDTLSEPNKLLGLHTIPWLTWH